MCLKNNIKRLTIIKRVFSRTR
jgi:hypothetical protein